MARSLVTGGFKQGISLKILLVSRFGPPFHHSEKVIMKK